MDRAKRMRKLFHTSFPLSVTKSYVGRCVAKNLWIVVAFEIYIVIDGLLALFENTDTFADIVGLMYRLLWSLRFVNSITWDFFVLIPQRGHMSKIVNNNHRISCNQGFQAV